ncbi:polyprenyl synthetase family protein [Ligilactobacillus sp. WILCCON 0076]|uniref:Polyprenyl synthetase family protein n=1 Tax=Ligilactobacillus ubinensis TaxID=2876789 RepID=A0A9X2JK48_9LACO|nr:polyprenyl synthetase family protein [Ligilactobacillus ubinensis]MCP0885869.1 polyprenyl synthetase family protein [Ligilactobacillus ubinensis]
MSSYWNNYPTIHAKIQNVCTLIKQRAHVRNPEIETAIIDLSLAGGKYLRPAFFFLFAEFGEQKDPIEEAKLTKIATSIEILHMATLIHDDIIDDSPLRRGNMSIQAKYGKDTAVYTGDLLFTIFFELVLESMNGSTYLEVNARAMKRILMGELDQMHLRYNQQQTLHDYLRSTSGKTAELFRLASIEGAYFGGADPIVVRLAGKIGLNIGIAFQMLDDILDYTAASTDFNKPVLEDLTTGVFTLPLLMALHKNPAVFKPLLDKKTQMTISDMHQVQKLVIANDGVQLARELAAKFTKKALMDVKRLPKGETRKQLLKITKYLLRRTI